MRKVRVKKNLKAVAKNKRQYLLFFGISVLFLGLYLALINKGLEVTAASPTDAVINCSTNPTITLAVGATSTNFQFLASTNVTLNGGGTCTFTMDQASSTVSLSSLTVAGNTTLTHAVAGTGAGTYNQIKLNITGALTIDSGSSINVTGKGYLGGMRPGNYDWIGYTNGNVMTGGSTSYNGGSHGGRGGYNSGTVAANYDSIVNPTLPGSGAGADATYRCGGNGGGVVNITAGSMTISGTILADGDAGGGSSPCYNSNGAIYGTGAGGSVNLNTSGILSGSGTISAAGGNASDSYSAAAGGGGRVAIVYGTNSFGAVGSKILANGGDGSSTTAGYDGAAGTIFLKLSGATYGDLYVDNKTGQRAYYTSSLLTTIPASDQLLSGNYAFSSVTVSSYGIFDVPTAIDSTGDGSTPGGYTRKFFSNTCSQGTSGVVSDGEISYNLSGSTNGIVENADVSGHSYTCVSYVPGVPTTLYSNNTSAASGSSNPTTLSTLTPVFSAQCNTSVGTCDKYEVQVSTDPAFGSTVWDSGDIGTSFVASVANGANTAQTNASNNITYASGTQLRYNTTYYWRIKFWNTYGASSWSTETATFYIPRGMELYNFNSGGAVQAGQNVNIIWGSTGGPDSETVKIEYATDGATWHTVTASTASASSSATMKTYAWTIPNDPSATVKIKITSNNDANYSVTSENNFTIQAGASANGVKVGRTFTNSLLYTVDASASFSGGNVQYVAPSWYNASWSYRKTITLTSDTAKIPATQTSFPVLVDLTDAGLAAHALSSGNDILFTLSDGTKLSHEIESYTSATGRLTAWVNVPSLAAGTVLYMYYGNAGASNQQSMAGTWNSNYKIVQHMNATTTANYDSTSNGKTGTASGGVTTGVSGKIGTAEAFATNGSIAVGSTGGIISAFPASVSYWVNFPDVTASGVNVWVDLAGAGNVMAGGIYGPDLSYLTTQNNKDFLVSSYLSNSTWAYITLVYSSASDIAIYVNNVAATMPTLADAWTAYYAGSFIGSRSTTQYTRGTIDEVRVSNVARTANWITTEYANQSSTSTFYTVGLESIFSAPDQTVKFNVGHTFSSINSFTATTAGTGSVRFLISGDGGSSPTWKYCSGGALVESNGTYAQASVAGDITDGCLSGFSGTSFNVQAILHVAVGQTATLSDISFNVITNSVPTLTSTVYPVQTAANIVTVTTTISDGDSNITNLTLQYSTTTAYWAPATLADVTASIGTVATSSGSITSIDTDLGSVDLTIQWDANFDLSNADTSTVYFRLVPNDGTTDGSAITSAAFSLDTLAPTAPGNLVIYSVSTSSIRFTFPTTTSTDTNFLEYKIFYSLNSPVTTADNAFTSSTDPQLGSSTFSDGTISASSTGYADDTLYYFKLFAFDRWGRSVSSAEVSTTTILDNAAPTLSSVTATNFQNGTGQVKIMVTVDDDNDNPVKIKTEYRAGGCGTYNNLAYTQLVNSVSSTYFSGDIVLDNVAGDGSRISNIKTSSGANETWYYWDSATDLPAGSGTYCLFLTPNDGILDGTRVSTTVDLDNVPPTAPGNLTVNSASINSIIFNFGAITVDNNFSQYKIHYRQGSSGVENSDPALTSATDPNLGLINYGGAGTTILTGLNTSTQYVADIWAYDTFGNFTSSSQVISFYTLAAVPAAPSVAVSTTDILHLTINKNNNPDNVTYFICRTVDGDTCDGVNSYVQADGSLGGSAVWQSYVAWGGADGLDATGLSENAGFQFIVQARNAENTPTDFSDASPTVYTYSGALSSLVATNSSNTTTLQVDLSFTSTTQSGLKIERDTSCDGTFETVIYDNNNTLPNSPSTTLNYSANTCYRFRSYSYNLDGALDTASLATSNQITTPPGQVMDLTADSIEENEIDWTWTAVAGAASYNVYLYNGDGILQEIVSAGSNSYIQSSLKNNSTYIVEVRAQNVNGEGISSGQSEAVTDASVPTGLHTTDRTVSSVIWAWDANTEAKNVTEFYTRDAIIVSGWSVNTTWTRIGLGANAVSVGKVKARNSTSQDTAYSGTVTSYSAQNAPTGVSFSDVATDSITATALGDFPNNGVGSAALYFSNDVGGNSGAVVAGTSWANGSISPNVQYTYTVYATNSNASTTATAFASKYTLANTPGKIITTVGGSSTILNLALAANSNPDATNFLLYCTTTGQYIDTAAKTLTGDINDFDTLSNWGNSVFLSGLTPNTPYQFQAIAKNGENIITASSTDSDAVYTLASLPANVVATPLSPTEITVSWEDNGNPGNTEYYVVDANEPARNSGWTTDTSYTFNGLTPGADYTFQVKAKNHDDVPTDYVLSAASAASPLTPGVIAVTRGDSATSLNLVLDANGNSVTSTLIRIHCTTTNQYVDTAAKTLTGDDADFATFNSWSSPVTVTGLLPNTSYQFDAVAKNTLSVLSDTSVVSVAVYTFAAVPSNVVAAENDSTSITVTWGANNNPAGTEYYVMDFNNSSRNSGWTTATSHTFSGLEAGVQYNFEVKARNAVGLETAYSSITSAATLNASGAPVPVVPVIIRNADSVLEVLNNSKIINSPVESTEEDGVIFVGSKEKAILAKSEVGSKDTLEGISAKIEGVLANQGIGTITASAAVVWMPLLSGVSFDVNGQAHAITRPQVAGEDGKVFFVIRSSPKNVNMQEGEERLVDINNDGHPDLYLKVKSVNAKTNEAKVAMVDISDLSFVINYGLTFTTSTHVVLNINIPNITDIVVSEDPTFRGLSFQPYAKYLGYNLSSGEGKKVVYVRLRSIRGAVADASDSIIYKKQIEIKSSSPTLNLPVQVKTTVEKTLTSYLKLGARGVEVRLLQIFLQDLGYFKQSKTTGIFGSVTEQALRLFQKFYNLKPTGYLDKNTLKTVNSIIKNRASTPGPTTIIPPAPTVKSTPASSNTTKDAAVVNEKIEFTHDFCLNAVSQEVRDLQDVLRSLGYLKHVSTGRYAEATRTAVRNFQKDHDIVPANGCFGPKTRAVLNKI